MQPYWTELTDPASRNGSNYEGPKPNQTQQNWKPLQEFKRPRRNTSVALAEHSLSVFLGRRHNKGSTSPANYPNYRMR